MEVPGSGLGELWMAFCSGQQLAHAEEKSLRFPQRKNKAGFDEGVRGQCHGTSS